MSSQDPTDRRDRSRPAAQNARQRWVPRGSPSVQSPSASTASHIISGNGLNDGTSVNIVSHRPESAVSRNSSEQPPAVVLRNYNGQGPAQGQGPRPRSFIRHAQNTGSRNSNGQGDGLLPRMFNTQVQNVGLGNDVVHSLDVASNRLGGVIASRNINGRGQYAGSRSRRGRPPSQRREKEAPKEKEELSVERQHFAEEGQELMVGNKDVPQRVQEIQDKLMKGTIECMICCDRIRRSAPIWSCQSCYAIFHLNCTKKWARAPTSSDLSAEKSQGFNWRCPLCQSVQLTTSKEIRYVCFCGKRQDPQSDLYLTPHSCGEPCGKQLEKEFPGVSKEDLCPHACVLQCHPGPCPPCKAFAPPRTCPCGKKLLTTRCSDRKSMLTCGQICHKKLDCGRHCCERVCHVGPCDPCKVLVSASCFCMKKTESLLCGEIAVKGEVVVESGLFACGSSCGKKLVCGNHFCADACHPGPCGECELLPSKIKTCHCGKTLLQDKRTSCLDLIPTCSKICGKLLPCGAHHCSGVCHEGNCPPCLERVTQKCRCGSTSRTVECHKTTSGNEKFVCEKPCGKKKNCGRHRCSERCCPLSSSRNTHTGDWDPHFCTIVCGKKLQCGQHSCQSLCHSGHCPPCLETIFSDLTCACGRTSIPPPLPCGTPHPSCQYPCSVPQPCGHQSSHSCHFGDCPPCSVPVAKECVGGHVVLRNIPCGSKDIRCNKLCGKTRQCGIHACGRACHTPPCDSSGFSGSGVKASCGQTCGAPRRDCRHTCTTPCHPSAPCPDSRCEFPVTITCSCGRVTATVPCDAGGTSSGFNVDNVLEASITQKLPAPLQHVEASEKRVPLGQRKLACDDECAKVERRRVLADAFDVNQPNLEALHFGESQAISDALKDLFRRDPKWVLSVEERCKYLVLGKARVGSSARVHVFCPMAKEKRDAVRLISDRWKLTVNSAGWEPKRFIVINATAKSKTPARIIGAKGSAAGNVLCPPLYDALVDMDPRLVVALFDLPSDADISALILRFGGECELVWLNDKNALAVFSDPARAATAMRRLDRGSVYHGAAVVQQSSSAAAGSASGSNPWRGGATPSVKTNPWKKAVMKESNWGEDSWGEEEWTSNPPDVTEPQWKAKEAPVVVNSGNRWTLLDGESSSNSAASMTTFRSNASEQSAGPTVSGQGSKSMANGTSVVESSDEVADDWEKAFE